MATNEPTGDNARKGAVRNRTQLRAKVMGETTWTKRDKSRGRFIDQKKASAKKNSRACAARRRADPEATCPKPTRKR